MAAMGRFKTLAVRTLMSAFRVGCRSSGRSAIGPLVEVNFAPACIIKDGSLHWEIGRP